MLDKLTFASESTKLGKICYSWRQENLEQASTLPAVEESDLAAFLAMRQFFYLQQ